MGMIKSEKIRMGLQKGFQSGKSAKEFTTCYGYQVTPSGELSIDSAEANIVVFIFECFAKGDSLGKISNMLARMGVASPTRKDAWSYAAISKLLANIKEVFDKAYSYIEEYE